MSTVSELFGSMVFNDTVMKERLPKETYRAMQNAIRDGRRLDASVANVVANAMKDWAIEKGATHFTHWFQPMTGITAEKHDSFITPMGGGKIMMDGNTFLEGGAKLDVTVGGDAPEAVGAETTDRPLSQALEQAVQTLSRRIYQQLDEKTRKAISNGL